MFDRVTNSGRHLWYVLKVIQQPERARACGSGPKCKLPSAPQTCLAEAVIPPSPLYSSVSDGRRRIASADRRPVDPPPVVELRIFEGQSFDQAQKKDITFLYNANFFLYATLEHARVMAHGRVQTPAVNTPPVLTGMPVSGMAYLDRPKEAGYFLFPDLSVRHEGRYRFNFNLYEETKEDKDKSDDAAAPPAEAQGLGPAAGGSFDWVMEVKSQDFLVYSAKKFPGLTESTALSRVVAEQGCRVRIRRDVRMRRRDGKGGNGDYENAEDEYNRRRRTETPEVQREAYRARSMSGSAERTPYSADSQRRGSGVEYPPPPPHYHHPQTPTSGGGSGHLHFLGGSSSTPQYPSQSFAHPASAQSTSVPSSPAFPPPSHNGSYNYPAPAHQQSQSQPPPPYYEQRRPSQPYASQPPPPLKIDQDMIRPDAKPSLPPISQLPSPRDLGPRDPLSSHNRPGFAPNQGLVPPRSNSYSALSDGPLPPPPAMLRPKPMAGQKRTHESSFAVSDGDQGPRRNGSRDSGDTEDLEPFDDMCYTRASGRISMYRC